MTIQNNNAVKEEIILFLKEWQKYLVYEAAQNNDLMKQFINICDNYVSKTNSNDSKLMKAEFKKDLKRIGKKNKNNQQKGAPSPILPKKLKDATLMDIHPKEIARQMTLMEEKIFILIRPKEFFKQAWNRPNHEIDAPNITLLTRNFNKMINWITTEILKVNDVSERAEVITHFIRVAKHFNKLRNYNGIMQVLSSLHSSSISRLKQSWSLIQPKYKQVFDELTEMMSNANNFKTYREIYASNDENDPCIPFIAVFLTDCTYLDDTIPDKLDKGWINWEKAKVFEQKIREIRRFNMKRYELNSVPEIQKMILKAEAWSDNKTQYAISQLSEGNLSNERIMGTIGTINQTPKKSDLRSSYKKFNRVTVANMNRSLYLKNNTDENKVTLTDRDWKILLTGAKLRTYQDGGVILDIKIKNNKLYKIEEGIVSVEKIVNDKRRIVATIGRNDMFGEISMLQRYEGGTTTAAIISNGESKIWEISIEFVLKICETDHVLSYKLHCILAQKLAKRLKEINVIRPRRERRMTKNISFNAESTDASAEEQTTPIRRKLSRSFSLKRSTLIDKQNESKSDGSTSNDDESKTSNNQNGKNQLQQSSTPKKEEVKQEKKEKDKTKLDDLDAIIRKKFDLDESTVLIREFDCAYKSKVSVHCTIYVTQESICFSSKLFGFKKKVAIPMDSITDIEKVKQSIVIKAGNKSHRFISFKALDEAFNLLKSIWQQCSKKDTRIVKRRIEYEINEEQRPSFDLTENDWELILRGANIVSYNKGDFIINEGDSFQRIFQLVRGSAKIEKKQRDGSSLMIGLLTKDDSVFGEISFIEGGVTSASIVANEDNTEVYIIEGYFLNVLFERNPGLSGRFYHYLAKLLAKRIKNREQQQSKMIQSQTSDDEKVTKPLNLELPVQDNNSNEDTNKKPFSPIREEDENDETVDKKENIPILNLSQEKRSSIKKPFSPIREENEEENENSNEEIENSKSNEDKNLNGSGKKSILNLKRLESRKLKKMGRSLSEPHHMYIIKDEN